MRPEEIPGLAEHAQTIWTPRQMHTLGDQLRELGATARTGRRQRMLFLVPPGNKCAGPLYEIVLMLDTRLRRAELREMIDLTWTTYESGYIQTFGPRLHEVVEREFTARDITGHPEAVVVKVGDHEVTYADGRTSGGSCSPNRPRAGSSAIRTSTRPVKQAFLQADAVEVTGDPSRPVRVAPDAGDSYRVGTSPIWRLGKKALGYYLPIQFRAGRPFHAGRPWQAMQLALNGMSRTLATGPPA